MAGSARPGTATFYRYGRGLYFSRVSSKSNDYNGASERANPRSLQPGRYRLMFMCKVAEGEAHRTREDQLSEAQVDALVAARRRGGEADSVIGLSVQDGGAINYEESVVYRNEAAIPSYLIVYRVP